MAVLGEHHHTILEDLAHHGHPHDETHTHHAAEQVVHGDDEKNLANVEPKPKESFAAKCSKKYHRSRIANLKTTSHAWLSELLHSTRGDMSQRHAAAELLRQTTPDPLGRH